MMSLGLGHCSLYFSMTFVVSPYGRGASVGASEGLFFTVFALILQRFLWLSSAVPYLGTLSRLSRADLASLGHE